MSDKLRPGVSVTPTFVDGESPPAAKLNSISVQMKFAAEQVEKAVGDIHGQSFPYTAANLTTLSPKYPRTRSGLELSGTIEKRLDIANLARLIGPASHLNPRMTTQNTIVEDIPIGVYQFSLRHVPDDRTAVVFSDGTVFGTFFSVGSDLTGPGDYHVASKGKVHTVSATAGGTATYTTTPRKQTGEAAYPSARFNVIPDPIQIAQGGSGIAWGALSPSGTRTGTLPTITHQQSNYEGSSVTLSADDANFGVQPQMPRVLVDNFLAGEQIPPGFLFVKNETTGEVYEDAEYFYDTSTTVTIGLTDITDDINAGHAFSLITVGNDITSSIDDLRVKSSQHDHTRDFGEPFIERTGIVGFLEDAGNSGSWIPSEIPSNFAPQYLHRDGWDSVTTRDGGWNDENAMRGDLLLGLAGGSPGSYVGTTGESFRLRFASATSTNACWMYRDSSNDLIIANAGGSSDRFIRFQGGGTLATGGVVVMENGYKGVHGGYGNRIHCIAVSGTILDKGASANVVDLTTLSTNPFTGSEDIFAVSMLVEFNTIGSDDWFPPGHTNSSFREYDFQIDQFKRLVYHPISTSGGDTGARWRAVIWYRE